MLWFITIIEAMNSILDIFAIIKLRGLEIFQAPRLFISLFDYSSSVGFHFVAEAFEFGKKFCSDVGICL